VASWYGRRFHGKKTASGELYDMYAMTAAHPTLPIPSYVRVTALDSGKSVVVRINDRGPFHSSRIIDLSYTAAHKLGYLGRGSTRVRVEVLDSAAYDTQGAAIGQGVYLQVGAFSSAGNAQKLLDRLARTLDLDADRTRVVLDGALHRVHVGPYSSDDAAQADRERVRERLALNAVMVRRD
jgi:rare lipoprotein A